MRAALRAAAATALLLPLLLAVPAPHAASSDGAPDDAARVARGLAYLAAQQRDDGTFPYVQAAYVSEALAAAGHDPRAWPTPGRSAWDAMRPYGGYSPYYAHLRNAYGAAVNGHDPRSVHGEDLVALVRAGFAHGQFGDVTWVNDDAWAILALRAAGVPADDPQIQDAALFLELARAQDGGWNLQTRPVAGDTDLTGMALAALKAAGRDLSNDLRAKIFLDGNKDPATGAHRGSPAGAYNCQSTAWALHGYAALGVEADPRSLDYLRGLQREDGGFSTGTGRSHPWCTAEALVVLAGARHPLPGFAPGTLAIPPLHAHEGATLRLEGPFASVAWRFPDGVHAGAALTRAFPTPGKVPFSVEASGPVGRFRHQGELDVLPARPRLDARVLPVEAGRHEPVVVDATRSTHPAPEGRVARLAVDWGDGNASASATLRAAHAYARAGAYEVRVHVLDASGTPSDVLTVPVVVRNRAPLLPPLPERVLATRVAPVALPWNASDPDGDPVALSWRVGDRTGHGPGVAFSTLGNHTVRMVAEDPDGARAEADLRVEVVNVPPTLATLRLPTSPRAHEPFRYDVDATDPDGPPPRVAWTFANLTREGPGGNLSLASGTHAVTVVATDADGAQRRLEATLVVGAAEPQPPPLQVENLTATLADGVLRVAFASPPPGVAATVAWETDAGAGEAPAPHAALEVPLAGATEARVRVTLRLGALVASAEAGPLHAPPPTQAPAPVAPPMDPVPGSPAPEDAAPSDAPAPPVPARASWQDAPPVAQETAASTEPATAPAPASGPEAGPTPARQEAPLPSTMLGLASALVAALLAPRPGRPARSAPRPPRRGSR